MILQPQLILEQYSGTDYESNCYVDEDGDGYGSDSHFGGVDAGSDCDDLMSRSIQMEKVQPVIAMTQR